MSIPHLSQRGLSALGLLLLKSFTKVSFKLQIIILKLSVEKEMI
jgi:hypothetical protein